MINIRAIVINCKCHRECHGRKSKKKRSLRDVGHRDNPILIFNCRASYLQVIELFFILIER